MGIVEPTNTSVLEFEGIHLYHSARSNCSARVRLLLEEKELDWTNHHIDLFHKENITEEYFGINPKGLVPTLVHDGTVVNESCDILLYLEEHFPDPGFRDVPDARQPEIDGWLQKSGEMHVPTVKTFQYFSVNAALLEKTPEEEALYWKLQKDPQLRAFHEKHRGGKSFTQEDADGAIALLDEMFAEMDAHLADSKWMVGESYTLADIAWGPSITTLQAGEYNFSPYPHVLRWYDDIRARRQFEKAVIEWRRLADWRKT